MAKHVLLFPDTPAAARPSQPTDAVSPTSSEQARDAPAAGSAYKGLQLVYSRTSPQSSSSLRVVTHSGARRIVELVELEVAQRVQREVQERFGTRRTHAGNLPPQATEIRLRERLLDAVLFFSHPA